MQSLRSWEWKDHSWITGSAAIWKELCWGGCNFSLGSVVRVFRSLSKLEQRDSFYTGLLVLSPIWMRGLCAVLPRRMIIVWYFVWVMIFILPVFLPYVNGREDNAKQYLFWLWWDWPWIKSDICCIITVITTCYSCGLFLSMFHTSSWKTLAVSAHDSFAQGKEIALN